jgi:hypothetical protein
VYEIQPHEGTVVKLSSFFVNTIRELIIAARATVARGVDLVQVYTNFEIGRRIVVEEQKGKIRAAYGKEVIRVLAGHLTKEFGNGFSKTNLEYMRRFFLAYSDDSLRIAQTVSGQSDTLGKTQTVSGQSSAGKSVKASAELPSAKDSFTLSWSHYVFLLGIRNPRERKFYEIEAANQNWTQHVLSPHF